jgi:hypothetical protein
MGGIFAKLDNQDKIISLERKSPKTVKDESTLNFDILKDYINKYGYIRVEVDIKQLETYINSFGMKYFKKNLEDIKKIHSGIDTSTGIGTMMLSTYGLIVLSEKVTHEEQLEKFSNVQYRYGIYENFTQAERPRILAEAERPRAEVERPRTLVEEERPRVEAERPRTLVEEERPRAEAERLKTLVEEERPRAEAERLKTLVEERQQYYILLPKIYFSNERNLFIDFLIASLPKSDANMQQNKIIYTFVKNLMNKINETPNPEVKVVNTIGLLTRIGLIMTFFNLLQSHAVKYSDDEKMEILTGIITDNIEDIPYDDCVFYNDKINFIKFTPNVCANAKEEKDLRFKKLYETKCPEQEKVVCPVQEQVTCPACGEQKCPEHTCPTCVKEVCPESEEPSKMWQYTSVFLTIIVIVLVLIMIINSTGDGQEENLKNLSKLN